MPLRSTPSPPPPQRPAHPRHVLPPPPCAAGSRSVCEFSSGTDSWCNGLWTTSGSFKWTRRSGGTSSASTGPSRGPFGGGAYVYTEASGNYHKTAHLTSAPGPYSEVVFSYHMYGNTMGSLAVETQSGGTWAQVWLREGQQHSSGDAAWSTAQVAFEAPVDRVRFVGITGSSVRSDAAVSDVHLFAPTSGCAPP